MYCGICGPSKVEWIFVDVNLELKIEVRGRDIKLGVISTWVISSSSCENRPRSHAVFSESELN